MKTVAHGPRPPAGVVAPPSPPAAAPAPPFASFRADLPKAAQKFLGPGAGKR
jgi:hypothetical protein